MKPGQSLKVPDCILRDISAHYHNGTIFTAADRILGNVVGSGYTHDYYEAADNTGCCIVIRRYAEDGTRRYTAPDRRTVTND